MISSSAKFIELIGFVVFLSFSIAYSAGMSQPFAMKFILLSFHVPVGDWEKGNRQ